MSHQSNKTFYASRHFQVDWVIARGICREYGLEIATLETLDEMQTVSKICKKISFHLTEYVHVGGMTLTGNSTFNWYWVITGKRIEYEMQWSDGEPNFYSRRQFCLALGGKNYIIYLMTFTVIAAFRGSFCVKKITKIGEILTVNN